MLVPKPRKSMRESEDEWEVEAPDSWNITTLTVGDTITPDMWGEQVSQRMKSENYTIEKIEYDENGMMADESGWIVILKDKGGFYLDEFNELLKPEYQIVKPLHESLSKLLETDDEWDVEAPPEWDVKYLTTGDILDSSNSNVGTGFSYLIKGFHGDFGIILGRGEEGSTKEQLMKSYDSNFPVDYVRRRLKPGFNIEIQ